MKRLLCVFAHPDDECLGPGGTIAQCAIDGGEVFITCFTAGEAGTIGISKTLAREELASRRRKEMAAACAALGVSHRILGAPDRGVNTVDPVWAVREILADMRRLRPQVVMSFHRLGVSGHPDHIAVAEFVDRAFVEMTDRPVAYYGFGLSVDRALLYDRPNLAPIPDDEIAARVPITPPAMDRKIAAIRAHATQIDFFRSLEQKFNYREVASPEHFALTRSRLKPAGKILSDIWEGIDA